MDYKLDGRWLNIEISSLFVNTIQEFFDNYIPSKKMQHLLIQNKWIRMDDNPVKREDDISGLYININIYPEDNEYEEIQNRIDVVYEDEIILIVNKPKDLLVHSDGNKELSLTDMAKSYYHDSPYITPLPLHRLDKQTSGLVVYSKSVIFQPLLDKLMNEKQIRRNYLAFVKGIMDVDKTMLIDKPIGSDRHNSGKKIIYKNGQSAITRVRCLANSKKDKYSVLSCILDTGRTHQIRLHLSSIGYPILNDDLYGVKSSLCQRMGLVANEIEMYHPLKEDIISIDSELPRDLNSLYLGALK